MSDHKQKRCPHGWVDDSVCVECKKDARIAELEKIELQWLTYRNEIGKVEDLEKEVARLTDALKKANDQAEQFERNWYLRGDEIERLQSHIRAIAEHHQELAHTPLAQGLWPDAYHTERRDFALSILEEK